MFIGKLYKRKRLNEYIECIINHRENLIQQR